LREEQELRLKF